MRENKFEIYKSHHPTIEGWFLWEAAELLNFLNDIQLKENITGDIFEIGAYKGKLTLLLATFLRKKRELLFVNDIFDNQELNISRSGIDANLNDFMKNIKLLFEDTDFLRLFIKKSSDLTTEETTTNIRMFSVDGGHSEKETYDDMLIASKAITDKGIIIVDDFYNSNWPEVQKGVEKYFSVYSDLAPLVYFFNKFIFIKKLSLQYYHEVLEKHGLSQFCAEKHFRLTTQTIYKSQFFYI
jgi:hypothetical protein